MDESAQPRPISPELPTAGHPGGTLPEPLVLLRKQLDLISNPAALDMHAAGIIPAADEAIGTPYLRTKIGGIPLLIPLTWLRAVLAERPKVVRLPHSPPWLLGLFPFRAELLALVDPVPVLLGTAGRAGAQVSPPRSLAGQSAVLVVGTGEQSLAWLVEEAGDLAHVQDTELIRPSTVESIHMPDLADGFIAGYACSHGSADRQAVLDVDRALTTLLNRLVEEDGRE